MWRPIFKATIIAGAMDITAACIQTYISRSLAPDIVMKYIASGVFGKAAYTGGYEIILFGLFVHFFIVFACSTTYFLAYPKFNILHRNILLSSAFAAFIVWIITTRIIIPLSRIQAAPFNFSKSLLAIAILFVCIGLPITIITKRFYEKK